MRVKRARHFILLSMAHGSILLGTCASLHGHDDCESVATLQTEAPSAGPEGFYGVDSQLDGRQRVVPAKVSCPDRAEALAACMAYAAANGGTVVITSGTPSMEPYIHGRTYAVIQKRSFDSIAQFDLLVYMGRPNGSKPDRLKMLHRAVRHDRFGWLMSGDNNRWSESWDRVTPQTYFGIVVALFEFPQAST